MAVIARRLSVAALAPSGATLAAPGSTLRQVALATACRFLLLRRWIAGSRRAAATSQTGAVA
jgi:hypothetical protein